MVRHTLISGSMDMILMQMRFICSIVAQSILIWIMQYVLVMVKTTIQVQQSIGRQILMQIFAQRINLYWLT